MKKAEMRRLSGMLAAAVCIMAFIFFVWERPPAQSVTPEATAAWLSGPILVQVGDQWHQTGGETVSLDFEDTTLEYKKCEALADAFQTSAWQRIRRAYYQMPEGTFENIKTYVSC